MTYTYALHCLLDNILFYILLPKWLLARAPFKLVKKAEEAYREWGNYMKEMVEGKQQHLKQGLDTDQLDIIGQLVKGQMAERGAEKSDPLTDGEILGNMFVLILAGHETAANSIHFIMLYLALYPKSQRLLQKDLDRIFQGRPTSEWNYHRDLPALFGGMAGAVLNEELRLIPPVIGIPKSTWGVGDQPLMVEGRPCTVPKNTYISLAGPGAHRNAKYWPTGPPTYPGGKTAHPRANLDNDLEEFRPERWLLDEQSDTKDDSTRLRANDNNDNDAMPSETLEGGGLGVNEAADTSERLYKPAKGVYFPFSDGYRSCLGRRFAQVEVLAAVAVIFQNYSAELAVDEYASDEEVIKMDMDDRAEIWQNAAEHARELLLTGLGVIFTLQMLPTTADQERGSNGSNATGAHGSKLRTTRKKSKRRKESDRPPTMEAVHEEADSDEEAIGYEETIADEEAIVNDVAIVNDDHDPTDKVDVFAFLVKEDEDAATELTRDEIALESQEVLNRLQPKLETYNRMVITSTTLNSLAESSPMPLEKKNQIRAALRRHRKEEFAYLQAIFDDGGDLLGVLSHTDKLANEFNYGCALTVFLSAAIPLVAFRSEAGGEAVNIDASFKREETADVVPDSDSVFPGDAGSFKAWAVLFGCFMSLFPSFGFMVSIGTLQDYWHLNQLKAFSSRDIGWIAGLFVYISLAFGIFIGPLFDRYGPKWIALIGSTVYVAMVFLLAECKEYWQFFLCLGVVGGFSGGSLTTTAIAVVSHWFREKRGLASGVALAGSTFGGVVIPLILRETLPAVFGIELVLFGALGILPTYANIGAGFPADTGFNIIAVLNGVSCLGRFLPGFVADAYGRFNTSVIQYNRYIWGFHIARPHVTGYHISRSHISGFHIRGFHNPGFHIPGSHISGHDVSGAFNHNDYLHFRFHSNICYGYDVVHHNHSDTNSGYVDRVLYFDPNPLSICRLNFRDLYCRF
ncbi:hypothetical protein DV735_g5389, partial [Chaetothyriales sp. CBS 134920]